MSPEDWRDLATVLETGERATWGIQDASTHHLGTVLRKMAERCSAIADERDRLSDESGIR